MAPADGSTKLRALARGTLHLGVVQQPYRSNSRGVRAMTTADVGAILEAKYGIVAAFYRQHQKDVSEAVTESLRGALESLLMGRYVPPFDRGLGKIRAAFITFIVTREAERVGIPGTPTKAAMAGVNHRLAHPYRRSNARRPSFRDTGLYSSSFVAWVD